MGPFSTLIVIVGTHSWRVELNGSMDYSMLLSLRAKSIFEPKECVLVRTEQTDPGGVVVRHSLTAGLAIEILRYGPFSLGLAESQLDQQWDLAGVRRLPGIAAGDGIYSAAKPFIFDSGSRTRLSTCGTTCWTQQILKRGNHGHPPLLTLAHPPRTKPL
jgi:hypothetical protein